MKFLQSIGLLCSIFVSASLGCGARPSKPVPTLVPNTSAIQPAPASTSGAAAQSPASPPGSNPTTDGNVSGPVETSPANQPKPENYASNPASSASAQSADNARPRTKPQPAIAPVRDEVGSEAWLPATVQLPIDYWEAQYFNAQRIALMHYRIKENSPDEINVRLEINMQIQRGGQPVRQKVVFETKELPSGRMNQFKETLTAGSLVSETTWNLNLKDMKLQKESVERSDRKTIDWSAGSWGPLGIHQLLLRSPMKPGEVRQAEVFMPQMHKRALVTLAAGQREDATTLSGLLPDMVPIDVIMQSETEGIRVRMWVDDKGQVQKTIWPEGLNLSSFRISAEEAQRLQAEDELANHLTTAIPCGKLSADLAKASQVQYEITSSEADSYRLFSQTTNQKVKSRHVVDALVTVARLDWQTAAPFETVPAPPSADDLASSTLLPCDRPFIDRLAKQWSAQASEPTAIAQALLEATGKQLRDKEALTSVQPLEVVAQNLEGNSAEQAMLLTALLRNRQIPARVASGVRMRSRENQPEFAYHMWTEAWLNDKWVPMDATVGQLTSCAYLKFIHTSLADNDPYQPILAVQRTLKQLRVLDVTEQQ